MQCGFARKLVFKSDLNTYRWSFLIWNLSLQHVTDTGNSVSIPWYKMLRPNGQNIQSGHLNTANNQQRNKQQAFLNFEQLRPMPEFNRWLRYVINI